MGYGIGLSALFFAIILLLLLILYQKNSRKMAVELRAWRERLDITQEEAAGLLSELWNNRFPKKQKNFDPRQIRRWEAGKPSYPLTYFNIMQFIDDESMFDAIATRARRDNLDALDAFMGERTPGSPARTVFMSIEGWRAFYSVEYAKAHGLTEEDMQAATKGEKKAALMWQVTKKPRRRRKVR